MRPSPSWRDITKLVKQELAKSTSPLGLGDKEIERTLHDTNQKLSKSDETFIESRVNQRHRPGDSRSH